MYFIMKSIIRRLLIFLNQIFLNQKLFSIFIIP